MQFDVKNESRIFNKGADNHNNASTQIKVENRIVETGARFRALEVV